MPIESGRGRNTETLSEFLSTRVSPLAAEKFRSRAAGMRRRPSDLLRIVVTDWLAQTESEAA